MSPADNTPNFDAMSPEEIMAWMESLAKRQGASEGFTTSADMQVAEVDPNSVAIDEPGYVPYGKDPQKWAEEEAARKAAKAAEKPAAPSAAPVPIAPPVPVVSVPEPEVELPAAEFELPEIMEPLAAAPAEPATQSAMAWLESLAADPGTDFPQFDLSSLGGEIAPPAPAAAEPSVNPIDWLESLAQAQTEAPPPPAAPAEAVPATSGAVDPMSWLESLAKRQGARDEELLTEADIEVPVPDEVQLDGPGYTDYTFDTPGVVVKPPEERDSVPAEALFLPTADVEAPVLDDPAAWLDSLASSQGFSGEAKAAAPRTMSDEEISAALARGEVIPHDLMEGWMNRQLEIGAQRIEPAVDYDPDAPAVPAELPDWLLDQVGTAAPPQESVKPPVAEKPPLIEEILPPPAVAEMPDWLKEAAEPQGDLDSIFVPAEPEPPAAPVLAAAPTAPAAVPPPQEPVPDVTDTWGEALEAERQQDISTPPDWYIRNVSDPSRIAAVERIGRGEAPVPVEEPASAVPELEDTLLEPESELPAGLPDAMPDWLSGVVGEEVPAAVSEVPDWLMEQVTVDTPAPAAPALPVEEPVVVAEPGDMPDWLAEVDLETAEIPDWLTETLGTEETAVVVSKPTAVEVPAVPAPAPRLAPAPQVQPAASIDGAATLAEARSFASSSDLDNSLRQYEALIRANAELHVVSDDLVKLVEKHKSNPGVYRVLGDSYMRQGKLQAALDTYRKALNQL